MLPPSFLNCLLEVFKRVFVGDYPKQWEIQVLNAVAKDGHSSKNPKLRGIGIAAILARYSMILFLINVSESGILLIENKQVFVQVEDVRFHYSLSSFFCTILFRTTKTSA